MFARLPAVPIVPTICGSWRWGVRATHKVSGRFQVRDGDGLIVQIRTWATTKNSLVVGCTTSSSLWN